MFIFLNDFPHKKLSKWYETLEHDKCIQLLLIQNLFRSWRESLSWGKMNDLHTK